MHNSNHINCPCHPRNQMLEGFGAGELSLAQVLANPDEVIEKYKGEAIKYGAYAIISLVVLNHLQLHMALNQKIRKLRK